MDIGHNVGVRTELQSATDAAALAGAQDLVVSIEKNNKGRPLAFNCEIVKGLIKGTGGIPNGSGNSQIDGGMKELSAATVKLSI